MSAVSANGRLWKNGTVQYQSLPLPCFSHDGHGHSRRPLTFPSSTATTFSTKRSGRAYSAGCNALIFVLGGSLIMAMSASRSEPEVRGHMSGRNVSKSIFHCPQCNWTTSAVTTVRCMTTNSARYSMNSVTCWDSSMSINLRQELATSSTEIKVTCYPTLKPTADYNDSNHSVLR